MDGRKTQMRRVIKPQPQLPELAIDARTMKHCASNMLLDRAKYKVGDVLWVREGYCPHYFDNDAPAYRADYHKDLVGDVVQEPKWKPSIHMPRSAARLFLRVTGVRAERLQAITPKDAQDEGIEFRPFNGSYPNFEEWLIKDFSALWDSINAKRDGGAYAWEKNLWVWVYEFEKIEGEF